MTFLKSLWADMVEKRLWPIAVVLLIALVAVPLFLAGGDDDASDVPLGVTGTSGPAGQVAQVVLDPTVPVRRNRLGKVHDPFRQRGTTGATGATGTTGSTGATLSNPTTTTPSVTDTPTVPTTTTAPSTTPAPQTTPTPTPPRTQAVYAVTLRVGATGSKRTSRKVLRLTPLPSTSKPFVVYLGVLTDKKTAVFLLSSDVAPSGDGTCKPKRSDCETVELRKGDTEFFDVAATDGTVTQYQLDLQAITQTGTTSTKAVAAEHVTKAKTSRTTKTAKAAGGTGELGTGSYSYDGDTGLLQHVRSSARMTAHLPGARSRAALPSRYVPRDQLLPMPVYSPGL